MKTMEAMVTEPQVFLNAALRRDLGTFIAKAFQTVSPGDRYLHNWHIDAIVHELMQIHRGENRRLIVTQPPRSLKSICTSVAFVAWSLGHDPSRRFACVSYSHELAATFRPPIPHRGHERLVSCALSHRCGLPRTPRPNA